MILLAAVMLTPACIVDGGDDPGTIDSGSGTDTGTGAGTDTSGPDPSTGSNTDGPDPTTGAETDTDTDTDTDGPDPSCIGDPLTDAHFSLDLGDWPVPENIPVSFDMTAECTVLSVEVQGSDVVTALECDDQGTPRAVSLVIATTDEGSAAWAAADGVTLDYRYVPDADDFSGIEAHAVSLRRADGTLLVAALDGPLPPGDTLGTTPTEHLAPVVATDDTGACGWIGPLESDAGPMGTELSLDGQTLLLTSGQHGVLPLLDTSDRLAVDLAEATIGYCCHYDRWHRLLVRRVL